LLNLRHLIRGIEENYEKPLHKICVSHSREYEFCGAWQKVVSVLEEPAASICKLDKETREHSYPEDGGSWLIQTTGTFLPDLMSHISDDKNVHIVLLFA
jgi:hypothetical protein